MKAMKKMLALLLAVCMLVGMPLSIDVSAIGRHPGIPTGFGLKQAVVVPDSWNTGLPSGKAIALYFAGGNVKIDTDRVGAVVAILSQSHDNLVGAEGEVTHNGSEALCLWTAEIKEFSTSSGNDYYLLLNGPKNKTVADIMAYNKNHYADCYVAVRLYDKMAGDPTDFGTGSSGNDLGGHNKDGKIDGIVNLNNNASLSSSYYCHWNGHTWGSATNANDNARDAYDVAITMADSADTFKLVSAIYDPSANELKISYSHEFCYCYGGDWAYQQHFRAVTANGEFLYTDGNGNYKPESQLTAGDGYTVVGTQGNQEAVGGGDPSNHKTQFTVVMSDAGKTAYTNCLNAVAAYGSGAYVGFVAYELESELRADLGEAPDNGFIDTAWTSHDNPTKAMMATHRGLTDRAIVPLLTVEELRNNSVTIQSVSTVSREGLADRVMVEFSEPIVSLSVDSYLRVFDATTGALLTHDPAAMTAGGSSNHLQWAVVDWTKADASGKYWIGTLNGSAYFAPGVNTYSEICDYLGRINGLGNYVVQLSLVDWADAKIYNNYLVDSVVAVSDSGKKLFADNRQDGGEDRAVCSLSESLQITDIQVHDNAYLVMTFSHDVDVDSIIDAINNRKVDVWLTAQADMVGAPYADPIVDKEGHIHYQLTHAQRFGDATDKVLFSDNLWARFKARCDALTGNFDIAVRFEGGGNNGTTSHVVPGFTALDSDVLPLYRSNPSPDSWGGRHWVTSEALDGNQTELTMDKVEQLSKNELLVTFSEAVTIDTAMPYMMLRMVDTSDRLIWGIRTSTGTTAALGEVIGVPSAPMQWSSTGWKYANDDPTSPDYHKQIIVSLGESMDIAKLLDKDNFPEALKGYEIKFGIEEIEPQIYENNRVQGVTNASGQQLSATKVLGGWDGAYCSIDPTTILTPETVITVSDATITAENQITFKFSHSVNLGNGGTYTAFFRYVDPNGVLYGNDAEGYMQIGAYMNYADETFTTMTAHLTPNTKWGVYDIGDMINPTGALKEYMDAHPGKWVLCLEETENPHPAIIDTFGGKDGNIIEAKPMIAGWNDGLYIDITGTPIAGELNVTGVEIISDTQVKVTFSAPVAYKQVNGKDSMPFVSLRLYNADKNLLFWNPYTKEYTTVEAMLDKDGNRIYENQNGYTLESEGYNAEGVWVPYLAMKNQAMQWVGSPKWGDNAHTTILYTLSGGAQLPIQNLTDIINYDFSVFGEGSFLGFDIEENTPGMIAANGHVDNIVRADNAAIALDANFFPHHRDSVMWTLDMIKLGYKPYKITSNTKIISDTQIRVTFSEPVTITYYPFMAIRMIDKDGNLMWSGKENNSTPYQWSGSWEWENESHTSLVWTMHSGIMGGRTIYELANWAGVLQKFKNDATWMFVIEEAPYAAEGYEIGMFNGLVDNISSKDGTVHLTSTYSKGYDGILTRLNIEDLIGPEIELLSAQALDDQTIKLTFTEAVDIDDSVSMGVRYLTESGDSEVLTDGKTANFKGDWKYADDSKKVIIWTLNSKNAENLTDILNYNGKLEWNKGARVAFVIMDDEENRAVSSAMRINGIYDLTNGFRRLKANYATEDYPMTQLDIEVLYDLPAPEASADEIGNVIYVTNYIPFIIASVVMVAGACVVVIILFKKRKKNQ